MPRAVTPPPRPPIVGEKIAVRCWGGQRWTVGGEWHAFNHDGSPILLVRHRWTVPPMPMVPVHLLFTDKSTGKLIEPEGMAIQNIPDVHPFGGAVVAGEWDPTEPVAPYETIGYTVYEGFGYGDRGWRFRSDLTDEQFEAFGKASNVDRPDIAPSPSASETTDHQHELRESA